MSSARFLFVYGTLQSGFRHNRYARLLRREAVFIGKARIPGHLYGLKPYPGLRPPQSPQDWVHGEVYRLLRPAETLGILDAYEASEYRRLLRTVALEDGRRIRCWVYLFSKPLARYLRLAQGRWEPSGSAGPFARLGRARGSTT